MLYFDQQNSKKSQRWPYQSRSGPRTRNYLARHEQRKLLGLVLMVGLVLLLMREVANPDRWKWMWAGVPAAQGRPEPRVDTRVKRVSHDVPDAFKIAAAPPVEVPQKEAESSGKPSPDAERPAAAPQAKEGDAVAQESPAANEKDEAPEDKPNPTAIPNGQKPLGRRGMFFPGVDPSMFRETLDDTVFLMSDSEPFYRLCKILQDSDAKALAEASTGQATFAQLYRQPKDYRGKLVTMRGKMLRAFKLPASKNEFGITETWQTWILPENARDHVQLYVLGLPPDFPVSEDGMTVQQQVEFTGFFFKLVAYKGEDAIRKVPLLVARDVTWFKPPPPVPAEEKMPLSNLVYAALGAAAFSAALVFFILFHTQRTNRHRANDAADRLINEHLANLRNPPRNLPLEHEMHDAES